MGYADKLNAAKGTDAGKAALAKMSPGEIGWNIAGAVGGGGIGYMLAKLLNNRPDTRTKLLYVLGGAGAGVGGVNYAMSNMPGAEGFNGSWRDEMRLNGVLPGDVDNSTEPAKRSIFTRPGKGVYASALAGGLYGGMRNKRSWLNPADWGADYDAKGIGRRIINSGEGARQALETSLRSDLRQRLKTHAAAITEAKSHGFSAEIPSGSVSDITLKPGFGRSAVRKGVGALSGAVLLGLAAYAAQTGFNAYGNPVDTTISKEQILGGFGKRK